MMAESREVMRARSTHRLRQRTCRAALATVMVLLSAGSAFADQFYFTRVKAFQAGATVDDGATILVRWDDVTGTQTLLSSPYMTHAVDGRVSVPAIATNGATLYGIVVDETSNAPLVPINTACTAATCRSRLVTIDPATGVVTYVGASWLNGYEFSGAGIDPAGRLWALDDLSGDVYQLDPTTGGIVGAPIQTNLPAGQPGDIDFMSSGLGLVGYGGFSFITFDANTGATGTGNFSAANIGFDSTLVPPYGLSGIAFTGNLSARSGSPAATTCRLNINENRGLDELGHVNDPWTTPSPVARKEADQLDPPTLAANYMNGGPGDMARVGGPALSACIFDFGDAPDPTYATLLASNGARHQVAGPYLGAGLPDPNVNGQPNAAATGDDSAGGDDEDGVIVPTLWQGATVQIQVTVGGASAATRLQAWIDWGRNGSFVEAGDQILADATVVPGLNTFSVPVPATASAGTSYARFRISNTAGVGTSGAADSGEVEDHQVTIGNPARINLTKTTQSTPGGPFGYTLTNTLQAAGTVTTAGAGIATPVDGDPAAGTQPFTVTTLGANVVITESSLPAGWVLISATCTNAGGTTVGSQSGTAYTIPGAQVTAGATFTCSFVNGQFLPPLQTCSADQIRAAQRYWFFGQGGAIDFGTTGATATPFLGNSSNNSEGSTVVTDITGQLQFWSNGQTVFDRNGNTMSNGSGLLGAPSATQTVAAFPALGQPGRYFVVTTSTDVFTAGQGPNNQLYYSVVDMSLNGGLGAVTTKNVALGPDNTASEALAAVPNADGTGFWVITYTNNSSNIIAYLFDSNGPTSTVTTSVLPSTNGNLVGTLNVSPDGTQLVEMTVFNTPPTYPGLIRLLDFDAATGQIVERMSWNVGDSPGTDPDVPYSADFSPAGDYIYATRINYGGRLFRYHIAGATTGAQVKATEQNLGNTGGADAEAQDGGQVRRGPDGRMYIADYGANSISVVNTPDSPTPGYVVSGQPLAAGAISRYGLPQLVTGCPVPLVVDSDLSITKTDGSGTYTPGTNVTYTIVATNNGPGSITGAQISDALPAGITTASWTCSGASGGTCTAANGTGAINTTANLPVGGSVAFLLTMNVPAGYTGNLVNTASVAIPPGLSDTNPTNNTATDTDVFGGATCGSGVAQTIAGNAQAWTTDSVWQAPAGTAAAALNAPDNVAVQIYSALNNRLELDMATVVPAGQTVTVYIANVAGFEGPALIQSSLDGNTWGAGVTHTPTTTAPLFEPFGYTVPAGGARYIRVVPQADASGHTAVKVDALAYSFQYCECAAAINLVQQPGFEQFMSCSTQTGPFGNWSPIMNNIHVYGPTCGVFGWPVPEGINSVDLDGTTTGGIQQTITGLNPGQSYNLTFYMSFNPAAGANAASMRAQIGDFDQIYTSASNATIAGFNRVYVEFTAQAATQVLRFHSLTGSGSVGLIDGGGAAGYGVVLDDIRITTKYCDDFSDAPATYGIPVHTSAGPTLGTVRDNEPASTPSADGLGDDAAGTDDEDGLQTVAVRAGATAATAQVRATNPTATVAALAGWVDFNGNGAFDVGERAEITVPANTTTATSFTVTWSGLSPIPLASGANTFARFRIATSAGELAFPIGPASNGEVEDHPLTVLPPLADVQITKLGPVTAVVGSNVTYTLTIANNGPSVATAVVVADSTPPGVTFVNNTGDCTAAFPCPLGDLLPGATRTIQTTFTIPIGYNTTTLTNTATVSTTSPDPVSTNNSSQAVTQVNISADVAVLKTVAPSAGVLVGDQVTFTVSVSNNGPNTATTVVLTDVLPAGFLYGSHVESQGTYDQITGQWAIGTLPVGAPAVTLDITATVTQPGALTNTATKTAQQQPDPISANDSAVASINAAPSADVGVSKTVDNPSPSVGTNVTFTVAALNNGPTDVTNLVVTDLLPAGLSLQNAVTATGTYDALTGAWAIGSLPVNGSAMLTLTATVTTAGPIVNTVTRTSQTEADVNPANDTASVSLNAIPSADLQVTKGVSNPTPAIGTDVTFTVTIRNNGPSPATSVVVSDTLPAGLSYVSDVPSQGFYNSGTGVWSVGALAVTQSATLTVTAHVDGPAPAMLTNTATGSGAEPDPYLLNNSGDATINSQIVADLMITKTDNRTEVIPGLPVTYSIVVSNLGPSPVTDAVVSDTFPTPPLLGVSWTCSATAPSVCDVPAGVGPIAATVDLPVGGAATFTATGTLDPTTPAGTLSNTATVTAPAGSTDPVLTNNTAVDTSTIVPTADVQISKSGPANVVAGTNVTYTITVTNNGPGVATGVTVTDPTPTGLTFVSTTCAGGVLPCAVGTLGVGVPASFDVTFAVPGGYVTPDPITNTATVTTTSVDSNTTNNTATAQTALAAPVTDLGVTKDNATTTVVPGTTTTYTLRVTNAGPTDAVGALVTDTFDATKINVAGVTWSCLATGAASCTVGAGTGNISTTVNIAADLTGAVNFVTFTVQAPVLASATGVLVNTVNVAAGPGQSDPNSTNDTDTDTLTPQADVTVTKSGPATVVPGMTVSYSITVTNLGPSNAESVTVSDPLPPGLTFVSNTGACATAFPCDLGILAPNTPVTITATYQIPAGYTTPDPLVNTASVSTSTPGDNPANNVSSVLTPVAPNSDVRITKTGPAVIIPGTTVSYTITVVNDGPSVAQDVEVTETTPTGLTFVSASAPCAGGFACVLGDLGVGVPVTLMVQFAVPAGYTAPNPVVNTATVTSPTDTNLANNTATTSTPLGAAVADLSVDKSGPTTVAPGGTVTYSIVVRNAGPSAVTDGVLTDALPQGVTFTSLTPPASGTCTGTSTITCTGLVLPVGGSLTLTITGTVAPDLEIGAILTNVTTITSPTTNDPTPDNNRDEVDSRVGAATDADLAITKTDAVDPVVVGANVVYTLNVINYGPATATNVTIEDALPPSLALVSVSGACAALPCVVPSLAANGTLTLTITATATAPGVVINTATVSATEPDPILANNTANEPTTIAASATDADLVITKAGPARAGLGAPIVYTLTVVNRGPGSALSVQVDDSVPAGMTIQTAAASQGTCSITTSIVCQLGTVPALGTVQISVLATATTIGTFTNIATVTSPTPDPDLSNNTDAATTEVTDPTSADLAVLKVDSPDPVIGGGALQYVVTVSNRGPGIAVSASLTDPLPAGMAALTASTTAGSCTTGPTVTCAFGDLAAGAIATVVITTTAPATLPTPNPMLNTVTVMSAAIDPDPTNNTATEPTTVVGRADVAITKTSTQASVAPGTLVTYQIVVSNLGPTPAGNVVVDDPPPAGLSFVAATAPCAGGFPCALGTLAAGQNVTFTVTYQVPASYVAPNPIVNTAMVMTTTPDPNLSNNASSASTPLGTAQSDLEIVKSGPATVLRGGQATYTLTVTNNGPSDAPDVTVTDPTPAGLTFVSASGACANGFPCALGGLVFGGTTSVTVTFAVPAGYNGPSPFTNTATVSSTAVDSNASNNSSSVSTRVIELADVQVTKTVDNRTPALNSQVRFTITVTNNGPSTASGLELVDQLPAGLSFVNATVSQGTFNPATGLWVIGTLTNGASATLQLDATVTRLGPLANVATITHTDHLDQDLSNNSSAAAVNSNLPVADIQANKTSDFDTVSIGDPVTYTITVRNAGPDLAPAAIVEDVLPTNVTFMGATPSVGTFDPNTGVWTVGPLAAGADATLQVMATVTGAGAIVNTARASDPNVFDPDPKNNTPGKVINGVGADLQVVKTADRTVVAVGETVTFTIVVTNNGPGNATGVQVREQLPAGLTYVSSTATQGMYVPETGLWTVGALTAPDGGASRATLTVVANVTVGGVLRNTASIAAQDQPDPTPGNDVTFVDVESGPVDVAGTLYIVGDPTRVGAPYDFFLTVTNNGTSTITGPINVMVPFPAEIMFKMQATNWNCDQVDRLIRCTRDDLVLAPGQSVDVGWWGVVLQPLPAGLAGYAVVTHAADVNPANDVSTLLLQAPVTTRADVEVRQTVSVSGGQVLATIDVINHGPDAATAVSLHDPLPPGVTVDAVDPDQGSCQGTTTLLCELGSLPAGGSTQVRLRLAVPTGQTIVHHVSVATRPVDPDPTNNAAYAVASTAAPLDPTRDTDGDGMPDVWESLMGLNPGLHDGNQDPDGDGVSNAQEALNGTHPRGFFKQYFAEGVVSPDFFSTTFDVLNADASREAAVVVNAMLDSGQLTGVPARLGVQGRRSVTGTELVAQPSAAFAATIEADRPFASDRFTTWDPRMYGSALESGLSTKATQWFFAEGATGVFSLFYLLQNPDMTQPVDVTVRYLRAFGPPITRTYTMAPHSRLTLFVNEVSGLEATEVAADIIASQPIVAERAMYLNTPTTLFEAGHVGGGATTTSPTWFFAEGATGPFFDLYLLLANPNPVATTVEVQYQLPDGRVVTKQYVVEAAQRRTIYVDDEDPQLAATAVAMSVSATLPIVSERAMWWTQPGSWYEGHVVLGATTTGTKWALADGMIGGKMQETFYALIANQAAVDGQARVTLVFDDGTHATRVLYLPPTSRTTVQIATEFPEAAGRHFSVMVESLGATPVPLVVEGARYSSTPSQFWSAGGAMLGTKLQ